MSAIPEYNKQHFEPSVSPGLVNRGREFPAFEVKYLLDEAKAKELEVRLHKSMAPDPHSDKNQWRVSRHEHLFRHTGI